MSSKLEKEVQYLSNITHSFDTTTCDSRAELNDNSSGNSTFSQHDEFSNSTVGSNTQKLNDYLEMHDSQSSFYSINVDKTLTDQSKSMLNTSLPISASYKGDIKDTELSQALSDTSLCSKVGQTSCSASVHQNSSNSVPVCKPAVSNGGM